MQIHNIIKRLFLNAGILQQEQPIDLCIADKFQHVYPQVKSVYWTKDDIYWVSCFMLNGALRLVYFNQLGDIIKSKQQVGHYIHDVDE